MPQLRKDPIVGRWVIVATERGRRPYDFEPVAVTKSYGSCPFCEGNEGQTPPEIYALRDEKAARNTPGWKVRVVPSISPALGIEGELKRYGDGMYDAMPGIGAHEVIIDTPDHIPNLAGLPEEQISRVISVCADRMLDLSRDRRFKYGLLFKNHRAPAGALSIDHSHSQIIATPVNPKRVKEELQGARYYFEYKERCIYCDILKQELSEKIRVVAENDCFVSFCPFASRFPFEMWIVPKNHSADFHRMRKDDMLSLARVLKTSLSRLARMLNDPPYNYVVHTAPYRTPKAGYWKTIDEDYHWHMEIIPSITRVAGFEWGSGVYINATPPEEAATYLRELEPEEVLHA